MAACSRRMGPTEEEVNAPAPSRPPDAATSAAPPAPPVVVAPRTAGWTEVVDGATCTHVAVRKACAEGFCLVPSGCFVKGSPESEQGRAVNGEPLSAVTLTHAFLLSETEVTIEAWQRMGAPVPNNREGATTRTCTSPTCPVAHTTWFDAVTYANFLSTTASLEPCYRLAGCRGAVGQGLLCEEATLTAPSIYACKGYRLPTDAEWEYAARAGTRTTVYTGNLAPLQRLGETTLDPNLDAIGWYGANAGGESHPVGQKLPNAWGLHDVVGNVFEWTNDRAIDIVEAGPKTDPHPLLDREILKTQRSVRSCALFSNNTFCRLAHADGPILESVSSIGLRIARTTP